MTVPTIQEVPTYGALSSLGNEVGIKFQKVVTSAQMYQELVQTGRDDTFVFALEDVALRHDTEKLIAWLAQANAKYAAGVLDVLVSAGQRNDQRLFEGYFGGQEPDVVQHIGSFCAADMPRILSEVELEQPEQQKAYFEQALEQSGFGPDLLKTILVYYFHKSFFSRHFKKSRLVYELGGLELGAVYHPIVDTCKAWSNMSSIYIVDHKKSAIGPLSSIHTSVFQGGLFPLNVSVAMEAYQQYGISLGTIKSLGIPSAAWQVSAMQLLFHLHKEQTPEMEAQFSLVEQMLSPEQLQEAMKEIYKRNAVSASNSNLSQREGHERIARVGGFASNEPLKRELIVAGLKEHLKGDFRTEIELIWDACAYYKIPVEEVFDEDMIRERTAIDINNSREVRNAWARKWYSTMDNTISCRKHGSDVSKDQYSLLKPIDPAVLAEAQDFVDRRVEPYSGMLNYVPGTPEGFMMYDQHWIPTSPKGILMVMFCLSHYAVLISSPELDPKHLPALYKECFLMQQVLENIQRASQHDFAVPFVKID